MTNQFEYFLIRRQNGKYWHSKSVFLQVTLNFELELLILIADILTQILLTPLTFIALPILQKYQLVVDGFSLA